MNEDFKTNDKLAVIGKDVLRYTIVEGDRRYILRGMDKYEVIGVIGKENLSSRYDNKILYNLNSILDKKEILFKSTWWVDSSYKSKNEIKEFIENIGNENKIQIIDETYMGPNPLEEAMELSKTLIVSFILILLCVLLTLIISILYWIEGISLEIGVRKNYGATNKKILWDIIKRYIFISIFSMFISLVIQIGLFKNNILGSLNYKISYINIILSVFLIIILGVIFIFISIYKISKIQISRLLRE